MIEPARSATRCCVVPALRSWHARVTEDRNRNGEGHEVIQGGPDKWLRSLTGGYPSIASKYSTGRLVARRLRTPAAARLSDCKPHVPRSHPATRGSVSCRRARPARVWPIGHAGADEFSYTFDNIARVIDRFTEVIGLDRFAIYVFDYGAPVGFRLAVRHPERITAIISQNGNAYEEGLSDGWDPIRAYWQDPSEANREPSAPSSRPRRPSGSTPMASPTQPRFLRTDIRSITSICTSRRR